MNRRMWVLIAIALVTAPGLIGQQQRAAQEKGGGDETGNYEVVLGWPQPLHEGWASGPVTAIFAESPDRVFFVQRGELPLPAGKRPGPNLTFATPARSATAAVGDARREHYVNVVNREGKIVESWTQWDKLWDGSRGPHHIKINPYDPDKAVWFVDDHKHVVYKFTHDGSKQLARYGTYGVPGADGTHFNRPTYMAWLPDSTMFVADGYNGTRVAM